MERRAAFIYLSCVVAVYLAYAAEDQQTGVIKGTLRFGSEVGANKQVILTPQFETPPLKDNLASTNGDGAFEFKDVAPGMYTVGLYYTYELRTSKAYTPTSTSSHIKFVNLKAGETANVALGGTGGRVSGKLKAPEPCPITIAWQGGDTRRMYTFQMPPNPPNDLTKDEIQKWYENYSKSEEFINQRLKSTMFVIDIDKSGAFTVEDVPPGEYVIQIEVGDDDRGPGESAGFAGKKVTIPEIAFGTVHDLGEVPVKVYTRLDTGSAAPAFSAKYLDGKEMSLANFKGKYVLLDFWATWCGPCVAEMPHLKAVYDSFGKDPRFAMVGLSLDNEVATVQEFVKEKQIGWTQGHLGEWSKTPVPDAYGVRGIPSIFLIDPDGKIVAKNLRGENIKSEIEKALAK
ncbi:MAG: TlpA family protein disulfide reductase [Candidatus Hydrogenedentes bacterium]|nr:TlpA family protein disulfide reductase [Candidatus Hydrogenedentota bacterium]